ncbi:hypothetical protein V8C43DRAFT_293747 [Trichoderma afarasin]
MYVGWREERRGGREKRGEKKRGKLSAQNEMQHDRIVQFGLLFAFFLLSLLKVALHACCLLFFLLPLCLCIELLVGVVFGLSLQHQRPAYDFEYEVCEETRHPNRALIEHRQRLFDEIPKLPRSLIRPHSRPPMDQPADTCPYSYIPHAWCNHVGKPGACLVDPRITRASKVSTKTPGRRTKHCCGGVFSSVYCCLSGRLAARWFCAIFLKQQQEQEWTLGAVRNPIRLGWKSLLA